MRVWLAAAVLSIGLAAPAQAPVEYDLTWTVFARQAGWRDQEARPVAAGERSGVGLARLVRVGPTVFRLEWQGPDGSGRGLIGPAGPVDFQFPSPLPISGPPALPHLSGGAFDLVCGGRRAPNEARRKCRSGCHIVLYCRCGARNRLAN